MKRQQSGFTLVELLIVIIVIAILATITVIAYNSVTAKAHTSAIQSSLYQNATALASADSKNGAYPANQSSAALKASDGIILTYTSSSDGYCLQADGWDMSYHMTEDSKTPVEGVCTAAAAPTIIGGSAVNTGSGTSISLTTNASGHTGDLVIIAGYLEPANEGSSSATYGTFTAPAGATLLPGFPINTDDATMTSGHTHRLYVWYYYAKVNGSETLTYSDTQSVYWGFASVTIRGGATTGNPLAETASTNVISRNAASSSPGTPAVSLNLASTNSLVLWICGDWYGGEPNNEPPSGYTNIAAPSNWSGQPAIAAKTYATAESTGTIYVGNHVGVDDGMTAALLSFRG